MCGQYRLSFQLITNDLRVVFTGSIGTAGSVSLERAKAEYERSCAAMGVEAENAPMSVLIGMVGAR